MKYQNVLLIEIAKEFNDGDWIEKKDQSNSGILLIQTGNVGVIEYRDKESRKYITEDTFKRLSCKEVFPGDILISRLPYPVGRACMVPELKLKLITAVDCTIFRPEKEYNTKYLNYLLNSQGALSQVSKFLTGSSRKRISRKNLEKIKLPIPFKNDQPDLDEQKRITDKIDHLFGEIDKGIEKTKVALESAQKLLRSELSKIFNDRIKNGWRETAMSNICDVFSGSSAPQSSKYFDDRGKPFVRVSDLGNYGRTDNLFETRDCVNELAIKENRLVLAKKGTVVFPKSGAAILGNNRALLGMDAYIVGHLAALYPKAHIDSLFVYYALCNIDMKEYIPNIGYPSLNLSTIEKIKLSIPFKDNQPDIDEQKQVIRRLKNIQVAADKLNDNYQEQLKNLNILKQSILNEVFQGKL